MRSQRFEDPRDVVLPDLDGELLRAGTPEHERARTRNFALNAHGGNHDDDHDDDHQVRRRRNVPTYIAIIKSVQDVQKCMRFAKRHQLTVSVRTGGHNWFGCYLHSGNGNGTGSGSGSRQTLLIDLCQLNGISEVDLTLRTVTVGPAALGQELNRIASLHNLCFPTGHCVGVPVGGYLLGGGLGWFLSHYGYASESIQRVSIVDANGNLLEDVTDVNHLMDWMWLARGSACAFPGVVVAFTLRLHPLPPLIRTLADFYPIEDYEAVLRHVHKFVTNHPPLASQADVAIVLTETPNHLVEAYKGPFVVLFKLSVMADSHQELEAIVEPLVGEGRFPSIPLGGASSTFAIHESFESLPETTRLAYPPGHHWICRSYLSDLNRFHRMDWSEFRRTFVRHAPASSAFSSSSGDHDTDHGRPNRDVVTTLVHTTVIVAPERPVSVPGCYGRCTPGITILVSGAYQQLHRNRSAASSASSPRGASSRRSEANSSSSAAKARLQAYADAMHVLLDPFATRYDAVEHPVHRDTFDKSYPDGHAQRIHSLREALDPDMVFWDPSQSDPYP